MSSPRDLAPPRPHLAPGEVGTSNGDLAHLAPSPMGGEVEDAVVPAIKNHDRSPATSPRSRQAKPRPKWLADKIAENARKASPTTCGHCHTPVLAGLNADWCAWPVVIDAAPVDHVTAVAAKLGGRPVHAVLYGGEIHRLDELQLASIIRHKIPTHLLHDCPGPDQGALL